MLRRVLVQNKRGESMTMDLFHPELTGMNITSIDGLGPNSATINTTEIATTDGSMYNSARVPERNIVFHISAYWPNSLNDTDPETIRHRTYQYWPIKQWVRMYFVADERVLWIEGYVESNEPDIFNRYESFVISVICPDPWFKSGLEDIGNGTYQFSGVESAFEWPVYGAEDGDYRYEGEWENPVTTRTGHDQNTIFGNIKRESAGIISYYADADVGVIITIKARASVSVTSSSGALTPQSDDDFSLVPMGEASGVLKIYNELTDQVMSIDLDKIGLLSGDEITIDTRVGHKGIRLLRDGKSTNILNALGKDAVWLQLAKGDNAITFYSDNEDLLQYLEFSLHHEGLFEGV